jgi:hypothetical protein
VRSRCDESGGAATQSTAKAMDSSRLASIIVERPRCHHP